MRVSAADFPLLILETTDIDYEHFLLSVKLEKIPPVSVITVPVAFNPESVAVCAPDGNGGYTVVENGPKSVKQIRTGEAGISFDDFFSGNGQWAGQILANDEYPYVLNDEGLISFLIYRLGGDTAIENQVFFTVCFKRLSDKPAQLRVASIDNGDVYDNSAPYGAGFATGNNEVFVGYQYIGADCYKEGIFEPRAENPPLAQDDEENADGNTEDTQQDGGSSVEKDGSDKQQAQTKEQNDKTVTNEKNEVTSKNIFNDMDETHWAYEAVLSLVNDKILNGYEDGSFKPQNNVTRAELAKIAVAAKKIELKKYQAASFSDVDDSQWYCDYLQTALDKAMITGYPDGTFRPMNNITRQDLCTVLYRTFFAGEENGEESKVTFSDSDEIAPYAREAVEKLASLGIVNGRGENLFVPNDFATRAETAKLVYMCATNGGN